MDSTTTRSIERVIAAMRENVGEQLTIDDLARVAMFSKFHFSRIFQRATGISPGRFLAAVRLQQAKKLLTSTSYNVSDISLRVGYTSVGTFSSRFTRSVGLSPTMYRRLDGIVPRIEVDTNHGPEHPSSIVEGVIRPHDGGEAWPTFVGLFRARLPEGRPASCAVLPGGGPFRLDRVPPGQWHLLVHSVSPADGAITDPVDNRQVTAGSIGPITIRRDTTLTGLNLQLKPAHSFDPPVLLALLDVRKAAMQLVASRETAQRRPVPVGTRSLAA